MVHKEEKRVSLVLAIVLAAMAGGMGWGIRGQYGHQTGAMIAGVLVGLVITLLFARRLNSLSAARAAAFMTLGVSIGGSMTYGQTVGLTHDAPLIGNWEALRWGLLGLFIKGGVWIGLAGMFLGMALSRTRYRPGELALLLLSAVFIRFFGIQWLNEPYLPSEKILPTIYFSDDWYWEPLGELTPRREVWGGLLAALLALVAYARLVRGDRLTFRLSLIAFLGGGLGFSLGQCVQAAHAWNPAWFETGWFASIAPFVNWWNMMETSFGAIFAGALAAGVWANQSLIRDESDEASDGDGVEFNGIQETLFLLLHLAVITVWTVGGVAGIGMFSTMAFPMIVIPLVAVSAGRYWPYMVVLPVVLVPIASKTLKYVSYDNQLIPVAVGWLLVVILPIALAFLVAYALARNSGQQCARQFSRWALLMATWLYFGLNYAFFEFPWPWETWTGRTHSGLIFTVFALGLTAGCWFYGRRPK